MKVRIAYVFISLISYVMQNAQEEASSDTDTIYATKPKIIIINYFELPKINPQLTPVTLTGVAMLRRIHAAWAQRCASSSWSRTALRSQLQ